MSHYSAWGSKEREFIKKFITSKLSPDSCICKAHHTEAKRMWENPQYIPKWKTPGNSSENTEYTCIFPECQEINKLISPKFDTVENIERAVGLKKILYLFAQNIMLHYTGNITLLNHVQVVVLCQRKEHASHGTVQILLKLIKYCLN